MKLVKNTIVALFLFSTMISCNNWLDVQPRTESRKGDIFKTQDGFREVLIGAYIRLKGTGLYGGELTFGAVEYLAQHWEYSAGSKESFYSFYQYNYAESQIEGLYSDLYKAIADVNGLLENIEEHKDILIDGNYQLIKGEALAIRAYCHFNILQLFGPVPQNADERKILNYVKAVNNKVHDSYSYKEYVDLLLKDLDEAELLLKEVDPICEYSMYDLNHLSLGEYKPKDDFWPYRQHRMNFYSVLGQKARIYHWIGNKEKAAEYAVSIINAVDRKGKKMFILGKSTDFTSNDNTLSCEHILNVNIYNLKELTETNFSNIGKYYISDAKYTDIFAKSSDAREKTWAPYDKSGTNIYLLKKYNQIITMYEPANVVPLMRLSEMYLIAIEALPFGDIMPYFMEYCQARNIEPYFRTEADLKEIIINQYRTEFYGEGKMFYTYKRMAVPSSQIKWAPFKADKSLNEMYVLPLPKREIILNK